MSDDGDEVEQTASGDEGADIGAVPLDGTVIQYAAALASLGPNAFRDVLVRVQAHLSDEQARYERQFECVHREDDRVVYLVPPERWTTMGEELSLSEREVKAVRRAHERQLERIGSQSGRDEEFESALDIRSAVVVGP